VDFNRNRRGSWDVLREEYAPLLIDSLNLSPAKGNKQIATVTLHTRGPVDVDMPAYTLRDYSLHWRVTSPDGNITLAKGDIPLPTLTPASQWSGDIEFVSPTQQYVITVSIIRPTGYGVIERSYSAEGQLVP